ncbi:hypothetical protein SO802_024681 [Lithocarpus litseifolius]|uniref:Uncharacterized protein n=1 Tax=Lithocarpus litseifolius TaxID=425828 RepID=A0AAW2CBB5_9ROSI
MASKKFITLVVLFILMLLFASSKVESTGVAEASKLGSKSRKLVSGPSPDNPVCRGDCKRHR